MKKIDLKNLVKNKYGKIASQTKQDNQSACCSKSICCEGEVYNVFSDDYNDLKGYIAEADLGLGCGLPTEFAGIKHGDIVVDLGCGAGNDCFIALTEVGVHGKVIGIDFTKEMIEKAKENAQKLNFTNIEFIEGDIENLPLENEYCDIVISNCVLNLVPDKKKAFSEIFRILKKSGHFCVSDVVLSGELPEKIRNDMLMYTGCISGALQTEEYLKIINHCGFENIQIKKKKQIFIPDNVLLNYLNEEELKDFKMKNMGIYSITVFAEKPSGIKNNYNFNPENNDYEPLN